MLIYDSQVQNRIHLEKNDSLAWSVLVISTIISMLLILISDSVAINFLAFFLLSMTAIALVKFDFVHPYFWFIPPFLMYQLSFPILEIYGLLPSSPVRTYSMWLSFLALVTFIYVVGPNRIEVIKPRINSFDSLVPTLYPIFILSLFAASAHLYFVLTSGAKTKSEIGLDTSLYRILIPFYSIIILCYVLILSKETLKHKRAIFLSTTMFLFSLATVSISGQRDILLRVVLAAVFVLSIYGTNRNKKITGFLLLLTTISIPRLADLRNVALTGEITSRNTSNFIEDFATSEFTSASRNLEILIQYQDSWNFFHGATFINDFTYVFFRIGETAGMWFNREFFFKAYQVGVGYGFSLVGEGYMNFGAIGVVITFALFAFLVRILYRQSAKNWIALMIYLLSIPIFLYSIRGDFGTVLAYLLKHIALPLLIIWAIGTVLRPLQYSIRRIEI
jgi:oligosaccharide repeat unit polymerase